MVGLYFTLLGILALYGFHRMYMVWLFLRHRRNVAPPAELPPELPRVTVQLPIYNEMYVAERLVNAVCELDYPPSKLEIQVLDDSTDETTEIVARRVAQMRARGVDIHYIHRDDRTGFKAGALENGLRSATGELIAIFDADFVPPKDLLRRTVSQFVDERLGMVQVRWDHLNREFSLLTRLQAIFLDGHFVVEHTARNRSGRFFNFNGTAGIWRRRCIDDAGGWQHDTLTEDLDLSYRAQLKGWKFLFLPEITAPAELPAEMNAFKSQQHRWAKGSIQTCFKLLGRLWSSAVPLRVKVEATFHLTNNVAYLLMAVLSAIMPPVIMIRIRHAESLPGSMLDGALLIFATATILVFYLVSQTLAPGAEGWRGWRQILHMPWLISLGIGLSLNNARAVLEAAFGHASDFVRTPKHGITKKGDSWLAKKYRGPRTWLAILEMFFGVYLASAVGLAAANGLVTTSIFVSLFAIGFLYVGVLSLTPGLAGSGVNTGRGLGDGNDLPEPAAESMAVRA